ncbi:protein pelota homolog [Dendronephthya gigantea]|uniref:protein pelota homolog n=1 Tax=Dendronephthya gigantea TaxID=151771 RepID=UPI001068F64F|nr:protein pelota homolog [Dendronephthya gigantea]XP_028396702.1 protein pelota homolog [Dendronephthya gigantea]
MKQLHRNLEKDSSGVIGLIPDEPEDMWHAYNLIAVGDRLRATTIRRVQSESSTGSVSSNKVRTMLTIQVEGVEYDTQACVLRIKGRNVQENQYVKMGAYHTIDLELNRKFTLSKDHWDFVALERIDLACDPTQHADLGAVIMHEGLCHVCLITASMTLVRAKIDMNVPRKRKGYCGQHDKGIMKFYDAIIQAIVRHINFDIVKCVLLGSPGFVKDQFSEYMFNQATKNDLKVLLDNKSKFLLVHSSSGHKHALKEILSDPAIGGRISDTKASEEVKALDNFYQVLQNDPDRAYYGVKHVESANEVLAIETLLVSDELFRANDVAVRKQYVNLVESVKENGGDVKIFSSLHVSGEQLGQLSGVAAILRFPVPDIVDDDESDSD